MWALCVLGIIASMLIIWRACDGFEAASDFIGRNLSDGVKGGTINAIGSSLPELLTAMIGLLLLSNVDGFAFGVGTTAGSAIFNSAIIPGLVILMVTMTGVAYAVQVSRKVVLRDGLALIGAELLLIFLLSSGTLTWVDGLVMMGYYTLYMVFMIKTMGPPEEGEEYEQKPLGKWSKRTWWAAITLDLESAVVGYYKMTNYQAWKLILTATAVIGVACYILVESCVALGHEMGIVPYFIAVILAAAATSVPDTILSLKDAKRGEYDDAVANALGSNIFDICVALGLPLFLYCIVTGATISMANVSGSVAELRVLLLAFTIGIFLLFLINKSMSKIKGFIMIAMYGGFITFVISRAYDVPWALEIGKHLQTFLKMLESIW